MPRSSGSVSRAHQVGADDERGPRPAGLDLSRGERQRADEAGAGGVDVDRAGAGRADPRRRPARPRSGSAARGSSSPPGPGRPRSGSTPAAVEAAARGLGGVIGERPRRRRRSRRSWTPVRADDPVLGDPGAGGDLVVADHGRRARRWRCRRPRRRAACAARPTRRHPDPGAASSGMGGLPLGEHVGLDVVEGAAHHAGQRLAGTRVDEPADADRGAGPRASRASGPG